PRIHASFVLKFPAQEIRGRRECRALDAPAASHATKKAHENSHHGHAGITRAFPAQWFTAYSVLSPVTGTSDRAFLPLSPADRSTGLAPASGRQDHTALPSASAPFVKSAACVHRIPPHVRDDRETPLERRRDTNCNNPDSTWRSSKILKIRNRRSFSCRPLGQLAH